MDIAHKNPSLRNDDRYKELLERLNVIAYEFDITKTRFTYISKQAEIILGHPVNSWYAEGFWYNHLHPDDLDEAVEFSRLHAALGKDHEFEYRLSASDGSYKWFKDITSVRSENGVPLALQGVLVDITSAKKTELQLKETELRLSSLIDNLQEVVFYETSDEGTFITDNVYDMLGYTGREFTEKPGLFYSLIHSDDTEKVKEAQKKWHAIEKDSSSNLEVRIRTKSGKYIWIEDRMFAIKTPVRSYWAGFMVDITQRKLSEARLYETENRLSSILNNLSNIVFYENEDRLKFISENVYEMLGYRAEEFYQNKGLFSSLVHPDDSAKIFDRANKWFEKGEEGSIKSQFRLRKKDGSYICVDDIMFTVVAGNKKYWTGFFIDVSDRKIAEEKLQETTRRLTTIVDNLTNLTVYETGNGKNYLSENIEKLTGIPIEEFQKDNTLFGKLIHPDDAKIIDKKFADWYLNGGNGVVSTEFRLKKKNGGYVWIEDHMFKVSSDRGGNYLSGIMIDITETKHALEKMKDTEIRLATVLSNLPKVVVYQSGDSKEFISENITDMIGYTPEEILSEKNFISKLIHEDDLKAVKDKLSDWSANKNKQEVLNLEYRLRKKDGSYVWIEDHMFEVNPDGYNPYLSGILIDVTERKQTEQKITQSLREKEVLLKEIHHRVKNNLQVVSSLLKLQSNFMEENSAANVLLESQNRVRSMALVHQKLYQSKDFARVDFSDYVKQLTINLMYVYNFNSRNIQLNVHADNINIGIDVAIPCGLIINELVSNALKYAFNGNETGKIDITLGKNIRGSYNITISDNGAGFPENIDFRNTKTLGLQLVNTLVSQIDGNIEMENKNGTTFKIVFDDDSFSKEKITVN